MSTDYLDGNNPAEIAYQLWDSSSAKFLLNDPLLANIAKYIAMEIAAAIC